MTPTPDALLAAMQATWPPAATRRLGPWILRDGAGGGKRVSAATLETVWHPDDIALAEAAMAAPLFMLRPQDQTLDAALHRKGYAVIDPVLVYAAPVQTFPAPARMTTFPNWPPLQIAADLWAEGGIGPARVAVMYRATGPKTAILSRANDRPTGIAYVAVHDGTAMLHALEVSPLHRRQGSAHNLACAAAHWAADNGAATLGLAVTEANRPARTLYERLGMQPVTRYHYRQKMPD